MVFGDEDRNEQEGLQNKPKADPTAKKPGEFTRLFFGMDREIGSGASAPISGPAPAREDAKELRGPLNADALPRDFDQESAMFQHGTGALDGGTFNDLFQQAPLKPLDRQSDTFSRLFNDGLDSQNTPAPTPRSAAAGSVGRAVPSSPDPPKPQFSSVHEEDLPLEEGGGVVPRGPSPQNADAQKATRLFSPQKSPADGMVAMGGPSAFTRVVDSSALRSAEGSGDGNNAAANNPPASPALTPQPMASWPVANMVSPPIYPPVYVPQAPAVQMPTPQSMPVGWSHTPSYPAVNTPSMPQHQSQPLETATEQKWVTYLPLIIALNVLFFLAAIFVLIVVWAGK